MIRIAIDLAASLFVNHILIASWVRCLLPVRLGQPSSHINHLENHKYKQADQ